jgi:hypothetical protein
MCLVLDGYEIVTAANVERKVTVIFQDNGLILWTNFLRYRFEVYKFGFLRETAFSSKWSFLKGICRKLYAFWLTIHSNMSTRINSVWNHNHSEYDRYHTVISTLHKSPFIQLCVWRHFLLYVWYSYMWICSFTVSASQLLGLLEKIFGSKFGDGSGTSGKQHKELHHNMCNHEVAETRRPKWSNLVIHISNLRCPFTILAKTPYWSRSQKTFLAVK